MKLAVTMAELLAEGVPLRRVDRVMAALERLTAAAPALNQYPTLVGLAHALARQERPFWRLG